MLMGVRIITSNSYHNLDQKFWVIKFPIQTNEMIHFGRSKRTTFKFQSNSYIICTPHHTSCVPSHQVHCHLIGSNTIDSVIPSSYMQIRPVVWMHHFFLFQTSGYCCVFISPSYLIQCIDTFRILFWRPPPILAQSLILAEANRMIVLRLMFGVYLLILWV